MIQTVYADSGRLARTGLVDGLLSKSAIFVYTQERCTLLIQQRDTAGYKDCQLETLLTGFIHGKERHIQSLMTRNDSEQLALIRFTSASGSPNSQIFAVRQTKGPAAVCCLKNCQLQASRYWQVRHLSGRVERTTFLSALFD